MANSGDDDMQTQPYIKAVYCVLLRRQKLQRKTSSSVYTHNHNSTKSRSAEWPCYTGRHEQPVYIGPI